jgi:hypothetical protein
MMHMVWLGMVDYGREAWEFLQLSLKGGNVARGIKLHDKFMSSWMKNETFGVMDGPGMDPSPKWKLLGPHGFTPQF